MDAPRTEQRPSVAEALIGLRRWPARRWLAVAGAAIGVALLVGIPTGVISTPWYTRMTPVLWWNYPIWAATAALSGVALATYVRTGNRSDSPRVGILSGGILSTFAVGCPICNKLVVLAIGTSGALNIWAPVQPVLGAGALAVLAYAVIRRLQAEVSCPATPRQAA
jgi:hypothetical protein